MRPRVTLVLAAAIVALLAAAPRIGTAATPEESAAARAHFERGDRHYDLREYSEALREFKDAYRVIPDPVLLYNIGQCHWKLQNLREAIDFYRQYVRRLPNAPNAKEVQARIRELEKDLAASPEPTRPVTAPPPVSAPQPVSPPPLAVAPVPTAPPPAEADLSVAAPASEPESAGSASPFYTRWWFWTAVGVVAAGAAIGIVAASGGGTDVGDCMGITPCARIGQ